MTISAFQPQFPVIMESYLKKSDENNAQLKLQIEPWSFDTIHEFFPKSSENDYHLIKENLYDCITKFKRTVAAKLLLGTEIMFNYLDSIVIFEVKNHSYFINQNKKYKIN